MTSHKKIKDVIRKHGNCDINLEQKKEFSKLFHIFVAKEMHSFDALTHINKILNSEASSRHCYHIPKEWSSSPSIELMNLLHYIQLIINDSTISKRDNIDFALFIKL